MKEDSTCCLAIHSPTASPFEIVQIDYYDGTTEGLARCKVCGRAYAFDVLAQSDDGTRLYGFARIAPAHYEAVSAATEAVPGSLEEVPSWREKLALVEARTPRQQGERDLFVLAENIEEEVIASRKVDFRDTWGTPRFVRLHVHGRGRVVPSARIMTLEQPPHSVGAACGQRCCGVRGPVGGLGRTRSRGRRGAARAGRGRERASEQDFGSREQWDHVGEQSFALRLQWDHVGHDPTALQWSGDYWQCSGL